MARHNYEYEPLDDIHYEKKMCCETCLASYPVYKVKYNNCKMICVVNDSKRMVFYNSTTHEKVKCIPYFDIKRIETRRWRKLVLILRNGEMVLHGSDSKKMFIKLKEYLMNQLL